MLGGPRELSGAMIMAGLIAAVGFYLWWCAQHWYLRFTGAQATARLLDSGRVELRLEDGGRTEVPRTRRGTVLRSGTEVVYPPGRPEKYLVPDDLVTLVITTVLSLAVAPLIVWLTWTLISSI